MAARDAEHRKTATAFKQDADYSDLANSKPRILRNGKQINSGLGRLRIFFETALVRQSSRLEEVGCDPGAVNKKRIAISSILAGVAATAIQKSAVSSLLDLWHPRSA